MKKQRQYGSDTTSVQINQKQIHFLFNLLNAKL